MRQPTPNMTDFATKIATRHAIPVPTGALADFEVCRKFIDTWAEKPTAKQIMLVKALAAKQKAILPAKVFEDAKTLQRCLARLQGTYIPIEKETVEKVGVVKVKTYLDSRIFNHGLKHQVIPDKAKLAQVGGRVEHFYLIAEAKYGKKFARPRVDFNLLGMIAGCAYSQDNRLQFNPILMTENWQQFWDATIPHEVAHLICAHVHGLQASAHGKEWRAIMIDFGCKPERGHNMDVGRAQVRRRKT